MWIIRNNKINTETRVSTCLMNLFINENKAWQDVLVFSVISVRLLTVSSFSCFVVMSSNSETASLLSGETRETEYGSDNDVSPLLSCLFVCLCFDCPVKSQREGVAYHVIPSVIIHTYTHYRRVWKNRKKKI